MTEKMPFEWEELIKHISCLEYKKGILEIGGIPYEQFLRKEKTPLFIFNQERFKSNITAISNAFQAFFDDVCIAYAFKANTLSAVLSVARSQGCWAEIMSEFELKLAQTNGFTPATTIFNGPAKTREELQHALKIGVKMINIDSFSELKDIEQLWKQMNEQGEQPQTQIGIRLHPELEQAPEKRALVRKNSKLGLDPERGLKILKYAAKSKFLDVTALHIHIGTQQVTPELYEGIAAFLHNYVTQLRELDIAIETVNLGGGFASRYMIEKGGYQIDDFAQRIHSELSELEISKLILEPGRFVIGDAFIVLTKVIREKKNWGRHWLLVDAGAHFLIPLRFSTFDIVPTKYSAPSNIKEIGGPLCLPVDRLPGTINFEAKEGDILAILNTGAYTISMSEQFGYPQPAIYTVEEGQIAKLRRRERIMDWIARDV